MSDPAQPLLDRVAVVSGASRGIGRASALALAMAGAHVVACAKQTGGLEELDDEIRAATGKSATLVPFDLVDGGGIDRLGGALFERFGKVDVLVHAAAILGGLSPVAHFEPRDYAKVVAVNQTAVYRLIRSLDALLRASDSGRAIFLTSRRAREAKAFWAGYASTKAAAEMLVQCWADEVEHTPIRTVLLDPGAMNTRMRGEAYPGEDKALLPDPSEIGPLVVELARGDRQPPKGVVSFRAWKAENAAA